MRRGRGGMPARAATDRPFPRLFFDRADVLMIAPWSIALYAVASELPAAAIVDRVAVVVDRHVMKLSDIQRDLCVSEFLNQEPRRIDPDAKRKTAERLIEQTIIAED